jgi:hypothetical protein
MTILGYSRGDLLIHNPFALESEDYFKIERLGNVRWIVAPNRFHCSEVSVFSRRFPQDEIHCSPKAVKFLKNLKLKILSDSWEHLVLA